MEKDKFRACSEVRKGYIQIVPFPYLRMLWQAVHQMGDSPEMLPRLFKMYSRLRGSNLSNIQANLSILQYTGCQETCHQSCNSSLSFQQARECYHNVVATGVSIEIPEAQEMEEKAWAGPSRFRH